ncbi:MAG: hypothetical protein NNA18_08330 [Nitrospira sp.]|nr:hypothetical protein [Nitrospira sp.]
MKKKKTFVLRFSLEAHFPDHYEGEEDHYVWTHLWESRLKPELLTSIFQVVRRTGDWTVHTRNRGKSPEDEIEIVLERDYGHPFSPAPRP